MSYLKVLSKSFKFLKPESFSNVLNQVSISTSAVQRLKEIKIQENKDEILVEAVKIESERTKYLIPQNIPSQHSSNCTTCPLCRLNLRRLNFSDVLILNQFIESTGRLIPQPDTGLCTRSYKKIEKLVKQAQKAKLLPRPPEYEVYGPWDDLNTYFEYPKRPRDQPMRVIKKEYWK